MLADNNKGGEAMDKELLTKNMSDMVLNDPDNTHNGDYRYYDPPLLGFASAADPLFSEFKTDIVGNHFRAPLEWLPVAVTVISYFLPFGEHVRISNRASGLASPEWLHSRFKGEEFNDKMRRFVITELQNSGAKALAPVIEPDFISDFTRFTSNWSERHVAYAAGLGTFSLNRGLITPKGMAGRFGSVITDYYFEPSARPYAHPFKNCKFTDNRNCGACIKRCPTGAITEAGKNKAVCYDYLRNRNPLEHLNREFGYPYSACGKCQTRVPCEHQIPL